MPSKKAPKQNYKVGEVCKLVDIQPYVLRYWETEFQALERSGKNASSVYTPEQLTIVKRIKALLYDEGFTIAGAKKKLTAELEDGLPTGEAGSGSAAQVAPKKTSSAKKPATGAQSAASAGGESEADPKVSSGVDPAVLESIESGLEGLVGHARELMKRLDD